MKFVCNDTNFHSRSDIQCDNSLFIVMQNTLQSSLPRVIIVGDVHGCLDELKELLLKVNFQIGKDRLIFVGDLIGKVSQDYNSQNRDRNQ